MTKVKRLQPSKVHSIIAAMSHATEPLTETRHSGVLSLNAIYCASQTRLHIHLVAQGSVRAFTSGLAIESQKIDSPGEATLKRCISLLQLWQEERRIERWDSPTVTKSSKFYEVEVVFYVPELVWERRDILLDQLFDLETDEVIVTPLAYPVRTLGARAG